MAPNDRPLDPRGLPTGYEMRPDLEVSPRQAAASVASAAMRLIDVRTKEEFDIAHIQGSEHIPLHELERRADEIEAEPGAPIAVICHHGARSLRAALLLRSLGFPGARSVAGGIDLWARDVDTRIPRYTSSGGRCIRLPEG